MEIRRLAILEDTNSAWIEGIIDRDRLHVLLYDCLGSEVSIQISPVESKEANFKTEREI